MKSKIFRNIFAVSIAVFLAAILLISVILHNHLGDEFFVLLGEMAIPIIILLVLIIPFSLLAASHISSSITEPINKINFDDPYENETYPELSPFIERINEQNEQIDRQMRSLKAEHERQDAMRREFTANVSHELKTPLTSISGYAEIIRSGIVKDEDLSRFAGRIYDEAQRLIILVGDIIRLSQLDGSETDTEKNPVDLYEICESTLMHLEDVARRQDVTMSLQGSRETVYGSVRVTDEIVFNLCDNAVKYNRAGGRVDIKISREIDGICLTVKDTGIGVPPEDIERIFERFYRVDKSHSKEVGGTGLGLSIVKHGVSNMGARLQINSELGVGTEISVIFPLK